MSARPSPFDLQTLCRLIRAIADLLTSEVRLRAIVLLALLLAFALAVNGLNVVGSYVGRDFMTAIEHHDMAGFVRLGILYVGLFAAMTAVAAFYRFTEERLGLLWRRWLTRRVTGRYLEGRAYLRLKGSAEVDNPDQRIADDTRAFTTRMIIFIYLLKSYCKIIHTDFGRSWDRGERLPSGANLLPRVRGGTMPSGGWWRHVTSGRARERPDRPPRRQRISILITSS